MQFEKHSSLKKGFKKSPSPFVQICRGEQTGTVALLLAEPDGTATEPPRNRHGSATTSRPNGFSVKIINMNRRGTAPEPPRNRHGTATRSRPNAFFVQSGQPEPPGTAHGTATEFAKGLGQMHFSLKSHQPEPSGTFHGTFRNS